MIKHLYLYALIAISVTACGIAEFNDQKPNTNTEKCPASQQRCNGNCVPRNAPDHCGVCNNACDTNATCQANDDTFTCQCNEGWGKCSGSTCDVKLSDDRQNCGECYNVCIGNNSRCVNGKCDCPTLQQGLNLQNDPKNCKTCGYDCTVNGNTACENGNCTCGDGTTTCNIEEGRCNIDLQTDPQHCGQCEIICPPNAEANAGLTASECTLKDCNGLCRDGTCQCGAGYKLCPKTQPQTSEEEQAKATDACLDITQDKRCGDCKTLCAGGQTCQSHTALGDATKSNYACKCPDEKPTLCTPQNNEPRPYANGKICVNTQTNPHYCGNCNTSCTALPNATVSCTAGSCQYTCNKNYADCNKDLDKINSDGCETSTNTIAHCGSCKSKCTAPPNAIPSCSSGSCKYNCDYKFSDCNNDLNLYSSDGCECLGFCKLPDNICTGGPQP